MDILSNYGPYILLVLAIAALLGHIIGNNGNRNFQKRIDKNSRRIHETMDRSHRENLFQQSDGFRYESQEERQRRLQLLKEKSGLNADALSNDSHGVYGEAVMEALVARAASNDGRKHILLHNVYVPARSGTTEIDVLLLHESGIYVFESKNISGEISGSLELENWDQVLNEELRHSFHNPVQQNQGHINALRHFLQMDSHDHFTISYVVFSDRCLLKKVPVDGRFFRIVHCSEVLGSLLSLLKSRRSVYASEQLEEWFRKLYPCINVSETVKAQHNAWVQNKRAGV